MDKGKLCIFFHWRVQHSAACISTRGFLKFWELDSPIVDCTYKFADGRHLIQNWPDGLTHTFSCIFDTSSGRLPSGTCSLNQHNCILHESKSLLRNNLCCTVHTAANHFPTSLG